MIQIPPNVVPATSLLRDDALDTNVLDVPTPEPEQVPASSQQGDAAARYGALADLHPGVQLFAYASPNGPGGAGTTSTSQGASSATATSGASAPDLDAARNEAQALMDKGNKLLQQRRPAEAIAAYEEGFRIYPDRAFLLNKASALLESGRYAEADLAYGAYLDIPDAPRADEARAAQQQARAHLGGREVSYTGVAEAARLFEQGEKALEAGRHEEALDAFERAYELNPLADNKFKQAVCLEALGRRYAAADRYAGYLADKPGAKDATAIRGRIEKLRAEADAKPITAAGIAGGQEWMTRGNRLMAARRFDEAVLAFQEGFRTYPDARLILNEAAALLESGRYTEADRAYDRYLSDPDAPRAAEARAAQETARTHIRRDEAHDLFDQGQRAVLAGNYEQALAKFEAAYEKSPLPEFKQNQALMLEKLGRNYAAVSRYSQYLAEKPGAADAGKVRAQIATLRVKADAAEITAKGEAGGYEWMTRGMRLAQQQRHNEAADAFQQGFRTYPDRDFIRYEASALLQAGRYAEADLAYQTYLTDPTAPHATTVRAEQQEARAHMGGREATATGVAESLRLLDEGGALYKAGRYHDALQAFERAYSLNPLGLLRYNQAACLDKLGKRELAAQRYSAYLAETPGAPDAAKVKTHIAKLHADAQSAAQAAYDRGQAAFNAGRFKEAAGAFAEAYEQKPLPQFLYNVAASYDKAGDRARAVQNYQLYASMAPDAADVPKVRHHIETLLKKDGNELMKP